MLSARKNFQFLVPISLRVPMGSPIIRHHNEPEHSVTKMSIEKCYGAEIMSF